MVLKISSFGVAIHCVLPVLWMTHVFTLWALWCVTCGPVYKQWDCNSQNYSIDSNQILLIDKEGQVNIVGCASRSKPAIYDCRVWIATEAARVQEDATGAHLPDLVDNASQLCHLERFITDLLFRVWRPAVGPGKTGCPMYRMRGEDAWEMQRLAQCWLPPTYAASSVYAVYCNNVPFTLSSFLALVSVAVLAPPLWQRPVGGRDLQRGAGHWKNFVSHCTLCLNKTTMM